MSLPRIHDSSCLYSCRQSLNNSTLTLPKPNDINTIQQSLCKITNTKCHTLPSLDKKRSLLDQIQVAVKAKYDDEITNSLFLYANYKNTITKSNKTLKMKPTKRKRPQRKQSVIEREMNTNCYLKGIWQDLTHTWSPSFREFTQMVEFQGEIYILGGFGNSVYNDFYSYNMKTNKWRARPPVIPRYGHTMTVTQMGIYLIGGEHIQTIGQSRQKYLINEIQKFDGRTWSTIRYQGVFQSRKYHATSTYKDMLLVVGGEGQKNHIINDTLLIELSTAKLLHSQMTPFTEGVIHHAMAEGKDYAYLYGGINGKGEAIDGLYSFHSIEGWKYVECLGEAPPKLMMHTMLYFEPYLLLYGGKIEQERTSFSNEIFANKNNEWIKVEQEGSIPDGRAGHASCLVDDNLLIFGGFNLNGFISSQLKIMKVHRIHRMPQQQSLPTLTSTQTSPITTKLKTRKSMIFIDGGKSLMMIE